MLSNRNAQQDPAFSLEKILWKSQFYNSISSKILVDDFYFRSIFYPKVTIMQPLL